MQDILLKKPPMEKKHWKAYANNRPDLIILDIMMPEMNGFDVAAILKNDPQTMDIPIIVLSIVQDKARGFRIGVDRYLTKPIDTAQLFTEVGSLLEQGKSKKKVMVVDEDSAAVSTLNRSIAGKRIPGSGIGWKRTGGKSDCQPTGYYHSEFGSFGQTGNCANIAF